MCQHFVTTVVTEFLLRGCLSYEHMNTYEIAHVEEEKMPALALVEKVADDDEYRNLGGVDKGDPLGVLRDHPGGAAALKHT